MGNGCPKEIIQLDSQKASDKVQSQRLLKQHTHKFLDTTKRAKCRAESLPIKGVKEGLCTPQEGDSGVREDPEEQQLKWWNGWSNSLMRRDWASLGQFG